MKSQENGRKNFSLITTIWWANTKAQTINFLIFAQKIKIFRPEEKKRVERAHFCPTIKVLGGRLKKGFALVLSLQMVQSPIKVEWEKRVWGRTTRRIVNGAWKLMCEGTKRDLWTFGYEFEEGFYASIFDPKQLSLSRCMVLVRSGQGPSFFHKI